MKFFLLLVAVSLVALSAAFLLRELMVKDFREYLEGEREDRVYWVTAALESAYETASGWERQRVIDDTVWALMLGFETRLRDAGGAVVVDTESALETLSPLVKKRVISISEFSTRDRSGDFLPYPLFLGGQEIGRLEVKFLKPRKESLFISRSNRLLLLTLIVLGGFAIFLSVVSSRKLTNPIKRLTEAVTSISEGNLKSRVVMPGKGELNRLADAFNRMAQTLELQESLRKKLTSNVAHELRTPISAIRGELEGMIDGLIPMDGEHVQSLYAEIGRLMTLLEGIEELSQAEASGLTLRKKSIHLEPFLKNIVERFGKIFRDKDVVLELRCEGELTVSADPDRLSQILINLLSNALKASERAGKVSVIAVRKGPEAVITVADEGKGIKQEDLPFIFERFYRTAGGGLGLGLTIVKELAEAHGGRVSVRSEYGKGSAFNVSLPR
ncbi:MAG: ATP-binding protein [Nitrospirae bacterium]|nr:ATP-binding protein [Nitrospirota bacterium]